MMAENLHLPAAGLSSRSGSSVAGAALRLRGAPFFFAFGFAGFPAPRRMSSRAIGPPPFQLLRSRLFSLKRP